MVDFATALTRRGTEWDVFLTIEGVGNNSGLWFFCSRVPLAATLLDNWKPWLTSFPDILTERVDPLGGLPQSGELSVSILDYRRQLTAQLRFLGRANDYLAADISATDTSMTLGVGTSYTPGAPSDLAYIGNEVIRIDSKSSTTVADAITRGFLDTDPWAHRARDNIYPANQFYVGRRARLYVIPHDADSLDMAREVGVYHLDELEQSPDLGEYTLRGTTQFIWLSRIIPRTPVETVIRGVSQNPPPGLLLDRDTTLPLPNPYPNQLAAARFGDQVVALRHMYPNGVPAGMGWEIVDTLGATGELSEGGSGTFVSLADPDTMGAFRVNEGTTPATSRSAPGWRVVTHPVEIMLAMLLSSYHVDDGLELVNFTGEANYSGLPVGWGAGVPVSKVDVDSFLAVRARFPDLDYRDFSYGDEPVSIGTLITDTFLRPLGGYLSTATGRIELIVPRLPTEGDATTEWDADTILTDTPPAGLGQVVTPGVRLAIDTKLLVSSISYVSRDRDGSTRTYRVDNSEYAETIGQRGYYGSERGTIEIDLRSVRAPRIGVPANILELAYKRLFRFQRPLLRITLSTRMEQFEVRPGQVVSLSLAGLPNFQTGGRDWSDVRCEVLEKKVTINEQGARIQWSLVSYGPRMRVGWIAPAGLVDSVATNAATLVENYYTADDAVAPLPSSDADAFYPGDIVRLCNRDGSTASGTTQIVVSAAGGVVTLDGNFVGALAPDTILEYDGFDSGVQRQLDLYTHQADRATLTPGATGTADDTYYYGES